MTWIEGVGDEVVQFVCVVMVIMVAAMAWWSTNARPGRYRTVLVMRSRAHHPVTLRIGTRIVAFSKCLKKSTDCSYMATLAIALETVCYPFFVGANLMLSSTQPHGTVQIPASEVGTGPISTESTEESNAASVIPLQEMDSIVDADMAMLDNNRLHFYRRIDSPSNPQTTAEPMSEESETQEETEPASNAQIREMDSIVEAMEADVTAGCDFFTRTSESTASPPKPAVKKEKKDNPSSTGDVEKSSQPTGTVDNVSERPNDTIEGDRRKILIKLKYLNDTLKEVEGSLDELLKDFKWRHFSTELTAESRVRLIFNGRVLLDDGATLRACGLHDRAVVHCLVHPKRNNPSQQRSTIEETGVNTTHELITERAQPERAWDLENILMTLVSVALTVVWFFRCEYSNMFTASASVALFGLTVFYSVAIFGLYLSDTFQFDRRNPPPVPLPTH